MRKPGGAEHKKPFWRGRRLQHSIRWWRYEIERNFPFITRRPQSLTHFCEAGPRGRSSDCARPMDTRSSGKRLQPSPKCQSTGTENGRRRHRLPARRCAFIHTASAKTGCCGGSRDVLRKTRRTCPAVGAPPAAAASINRTTRSGFREPRRSPLAARGGVTHEGLKSATKRHKSHKFYREFLCLL